MTCGLMEQVIKLAIIQTFLKDCIDLPDYCIYMWTVRGRLRSSLRQGIYIYENSGLDGIKVTMSGVAKGRKTQ